MAKPIRWMETCIEKLKLLNAVIGDFHTKEQLLTDLQNKIGNKTDEYHLSLLFAHPQMDDCIPGSSDTRKCRLFDYIKDDKVVVRDVKFTPVKNRSPDEGHYVEIMAQDIDRKPKGYACQHCYFQRRITCFLDRIIHVLIEAKLDIGMRSVRTLTNFAFVGIRTKDKNDKTTDHFLAFKCNKEKNTIELEETQAREYNEKEKKRVEEFNARATKEGILLEKFIERKVTKEDFYIVSAQSDVLQFLKVVERNSVWTIDQEDDPLTSLRFDNPELELIKLNSVMFVDKSETILPFNTEFAKRIEVAFQIAYTTDKEFKEIEDILLKKNPTKLKKKEEKKSKSIWDIIKNSEIIESIRTSIAIRVGICVTISFIMLFIIREVSRPKPKLYSAVAIL